MRSRNPLVIVSLGSSELAYWVPGRVEPRLRAWRNPWRTFASNCFVSSIYYVTLRLRPMHTPRPSPAEPGRGGLTGVKWASTIKCPFTNVKYHFRQGVTPMKGLCLSAMFLGLTLCGVGY